MALDSARPLRSSIPRTDWLPATSLGPKRSLSHCARHRYSCALGHSRTSPGSVPVTTPDWVARRVATDLVHLDVAASGRPSATAWAQREHLDALAAARPLGSGA